MTIEVKSIEDMKAFGRRLAALLRGGDYVELIGDLGAGKTTLTKGIAEGLKITEDIQSPSFTISRVYRVSEDLELAHYDFYRLADAGIMEQELKEVISDGKTIIVVEWGEIIDEVAPVDRLTIRIEPRAETIRRIAIESRGPRSQEIEEQL